MVNNTAHHGVFILRYNEEDQLFVGTNPNTNSYFPYADSEYHSDKCVKDQYYASVHDL